MNSCSLVVGKVWELENSCKRETKAAVRLKESVFKIKCIPRLESRLLEAVFPLRS